MQPVGNEQVKEEDVFETNDEVWHYDNLEQYQPTRNPDGGLFTQYVNTFMKIKGYRCLHILKIDTRMLFNSTKNALNGKQETLKMFRLDKEKILVESMILIQNGCCSNSSSYATMGAPINENSMPIDMEAATRHHILKIVEVRHYKLTYFKLNFKFKTPIIIKLHFKKQKFHSLMDTSNFLIVKNQGNCTGWKETYTSLLNTKEDVPAKLEAVLKPCNTKQCKMPDSTYFDSCVEAQSNLSMEWMQVLPQMPGKVSTLSSNCG
uniref:Vitellogenin n=1 Tax=Romanomermis culicivorax TaxID=13658 RepID=A0A915KBQ3_ROMCU